MLLPHLNLPVTSIILIWSKLDPWILRLNIILPSFFMALLTPNCPSFLPLFTCRSISHERKGRLVALLERKLWESLSELDRCLKQVIQRFRKGHSNGKEEKIWSLGRVSIRLARTGLLVALYCVFSVWKGVWHILETQCLFGRQTLSSLYPWIFVLCFFIVSPLYVLKYGEMGWLRLSLPCVTEDIAQ